jgi:hypothetical protein
MSDDGKNGAGSKMADARHNAGGIETVVGTRRPITRNQKDHITNNMYVECGRCSACR